MSEEEVAAGTPKAAMTETVETSTKMFDNSNLKEDVIKPEDEVKEPAKEPDADKSADKTEEEPVKDGDKSKAKSSDKLPDAYEFEVDDDEPITDAQLDEIAAYAKERGLSQEQAQSLVDMQSKAMQDQQEQLKADHESTVDKWEADVKADVELGGDKYGENLELAKRGMERFFTPDFTKYINETGFGNHPEVIRGFMKIGQALADDKLVMAGAAGEVKSAEDTLYDNTGTKN